MLSPSSPTLPIQLSPDLVLKRASALAELEAVVACHAAVFGENERTAIVLNLCQRPGQTPQDVLYVQDTVTGEAVSSVSLIRETWSYEGIPLPVGEVGMVSTREAYRNKGLVRAQFDVYHRLALEAGCLLSAINGIPYFYRQFGYDYMLPLLGGVNLPVEQVPDPAPGDHLPYQVRVARPEDMRLLQQYYATLVRPLCVAAILPDEIWLYQDSQPADSDDCKTTYLIEREGAPAGYMRIMTHEDLRWRRGVCILDAHLPDEKACMAVLRFTKRIAQEQRQDHSIHVEIPFDSPLVRLAAALGAAPVRDYAWQVRVLDPVRLLLTIGPALEQRLAASELAGLTQDIILNLYRKAFVLSFQKGRLHRVATVSSPSASDLRCPPALMPAIWLGYRSIEEVLAFYPDAACKPESRRALDVLFPKRDSWVSTLF